MVFLERCKIPQIVCKIYIYTVKEHFKYDIWLVTAVNWVKYRVSDPEPGFKKSSDPDAVLRKVETGSWFNPTTQFGSWFDPTAQS